MVSELRRAKVGKADPHVVAWVANVPVASLFLSAITIVGAGMGCAADRAPRSGAGGAVAGLAGGAGVTGVFGADDLAILAL